MLYSVTAMRLTHDGRWEVVEYALSRTMPVAQFAEYSTKMPEKKLLEAKLHEFYELAEQQTPPSRSKSDRMMRRNRRKK